MNQPPFVADISNQQIFKKLQDKIENHSVWSQHFINQIKKSYAFT